MWLVRGGCEVPSTFFIAIDNPKSMLFVEKKTLYRPLNI